MERLCLRLAESSLVMLFCWGQGTKHLYYLVACRPRERSSPLPVHKEPKNETTPPPHTHTDTQTDRQTDTHNCKAPHEKYCRPMQLASKIVQVNHRSRYPASCAWSPKMDSSIKGNTHSYICPKPNR